jgi:type IV pilus assembly protein PilV
MAKHDLAEWNAAIATYLPMGQGFVCVDSTPNDGTSAASPACDGSGTQLTVKIWWDDNRDGAINMTATNTERLAIMAEL